MTFSGLETKNEGKNIQLNIMLTLRGENLVSGLLVYYYEYTYVKFMTLILISAALREE